MKTRLYKSRETGTLYELSGYSYSSFNGYKCEKTFKPVGTKTDKDNKITLICEGKEDLEYKEIIKKIDEKISSVFEIADPEIPYDLIKCNSTFRGKPVFKLILKCPICGKPLKTGCCYITYPSTTEHKCDTCGLLFEKMLVSGNCITGYETEEEIKVLLDSGYEGERKLYDCMTSERRLRNNIDL